MLGHSISKIKQSRTALLLFYIPPVLALALIAGVSYRLQIPVGRFTRDPTEMVGMHPFLGMLSVIGSWAWCATATVCFFSYIVLRQAENQQFPRFFLGGSLISLLLLLDDVFMLHERTYEAYFHISEKKIFLIYGIIVLLYFLIFRSLLVKTNLIFLILAIAFFALSIYVDQRPQTSLFWHHLFEDGFKFLGIVSWLGYYFTSCVERVRALLSRTSSLGDSFLKEDSSRV